MVHVLNSPTIDVFIQQLDPLPAESHIGMFLLKAIFYC